jgi:hypothetical protein
MVNDLCTSLAGFKASNTTPFPPKKEKGTGTFEEVLTPDAYR